MIRYHSATHAQAVGHAVDVVEPRRNQIDLQDGGIVEAMLPKSVEVLGRDLLGVARELSGVIEHRAVGGGQLGLRVIPTQRVGKFVVERGPAQELGVAFPSVEAAIDC
jgi:hypothetical protein